MRARVRECVSSKNSSDTGRSRMQRSLVNLTPEIVAGRSSGRIERLIHVINCPPRRERTISSLSLFRSKHQAAHRSIARPSKSSRRRSVRRRPCLSSLSANAPETRGFDRSRERRRRDRSRLPVPSTANNSRRSARSAAASSRHSRNNPRDGKRREARGKD